MSLDRWRVRQHRHSAVWLALALAVTACENTPPAGYGPAAGTSAVAVDSPEAGPSGAAASDIARRLASAEAGIDLLADSIDDLLHPVPLLTAAQERAFARFRNADHLERAEALGVDPGAPAPDALVPIDSSGRYWIVRELDHSEPLVTPAALELLQEIGRRFHDRLEAEGLPAYRFEVTSALRTAASQASLRRDNPNAAPGRSAHEYGTTIDITYAAFAAPASAESAAGEVARSSPPAGSSTPESPPPGPGPFSESNAGPAWLEAHLERDRVARLETVAARRSRELQAFLGEVLLDLQGEGAALVALERRQPVFHITLGRADSP
jgi:hypothetical protein